MTALAHFTFILLFGKPVPNLSHVTVMNVWPQSYMTVEQNRPLFIELIEIYLVYCLKNSARMILQHA